MLVLISTTARPFIAFPTYLLWLDREAEEFELQTEEIESVRWMDYAQVRGMVASDTLPNCIIMEELDLIERHFL